MNNEKENWTEEVVESMQGSQRAQPRADLFAEIQEKVSTVGLKTLPMVSLRNYAAAAVLIILLNTAAMIFYARHDRYLANETESISSHYEPIYISFQIYN